jgi:hypothetical protein
MGRLLIYTFQTRFTQHFGYTITLHLLYCELRKLSSTIFFVSVRPLMLHVCAFLTFCCSASRNTASPKAHPSLSAEPHTPVHIPRSAVHAFIGFRYFDHAHRQAFLHSHSLEPPSPFTSVASCILVCATSGATRHPRCLDARPETTPRTNNRPYTWSVRIDCPNCPLSAKPAATRTPKAPFLLPVCVYALKSTNSTANRRAATLGKRQRR